MRTLLPYSESSQIKCFFFFTCIYVYVSKNDSESIYLFLVHYVLPYSKCHLKSQGGPHKVCYVSNLNPSLTSPLNQIVASSIRIIVTRHLDISGNYICMFKHITQTHTISHVRIYLSDENTYKHLIK